MRYFRKPYAYAYLFTVLLTLSMIWSLLYIFLIPQDGTAVQQEAEAPITPIPTVSPSAQESQTPTPSPAPFPIISTDTEFSDGSMYISLETIREFYTDIYVARVELTDPAQLKTAFAQDAYGVNIREKTSVTAERVGAILAINGDYYGANRAGYVIRNGVLYRDSIRTKNKGIDLVVYGDGSFGLIKESDVSAASLIDAGATQLFAFGPTLVEEGLITVSRREGSTQDLTDNPRTALGILSPLSYVFVVCDGRTEKSLGLTIYELAEIMVSCGCKTAYNLDGGGSSTMVFNSKLVNNPTTNGNNVSERSVSDIVYIIP